MSDEESRELSAPGEGAADGTDQTPAHRSSSDELIADPGLPAHEPRPTDVSPAAEKRAERQVAALFGLSAVFSLLMCVAYLTLSVGQDEGGSDKTDLFLGLGASHLALGTCLGLALLLIGIGAIQWARKLMTDQEIVEFRHPAASSEEDRTEAIAALNSGVDESGIARRPMIRNSLLLGMGALGAPALLLLGDLGPLPGNKLAHTVWDNLDEEGKKRPEPMRLVQDVTGIPIKPSDVEIGQLINAEPSVFYETDEQGEHIIHGAELQAAKGKAAIVIVRIEPEQIRHGKGRDDWAVDGILCYSKICTHVGCPISLYEQQTHHLLCPCHQSTFDLADSAKVIFGPAARPLPQLPIKVDEEGYLVARSDFTEPVGPSYWERG